MSFSDIVCTIIQYTFVVSFNIFTNRTLHPHIHTCSLCVCVFASVSVYLCLWSPFRQIFLLTASQPVTARSYLSWETSQEDFPTKSRHPLGLVLLLHPDSYSVDAGDCPLGAETHTVCWLAPSEVETLAKGANIFSVAQPQRSGFESSLVLCHDWAGPPGPIQFYFFHRSSRPGHLQVQVASGNCHAKRPTCLTPYLSVLDVAPRLMSSYQDGADSEDRVWRLHELPEDSATVSSSGHSLSTGVVCSWRCVTVHCSLYTVN